MVLWFLLWVLHIITSCSALEVIELMLQFHWSLIVLGIPVSEENNYVSQRAAHCSASVFHSEGKIKLLAGHKMSPFPFLLISVLPSCLIFSIRVKPLVLDIALSHFIWFISFNSNYIVLYCVISLSTIIFSMLVFSLAHCHRFVFMPTSLLPFPPPPQPGCESPFPTRYGTRMIQHKTIPLTDTFSCL